MTFPFLRFFNWLKRNFVINDNNLEKNLKDYKTILLANNLPVIYTVEHLCLVADVPIKLIREICNSNRINYYRRFKLRKKRGGYRLIQTPFDTLKYLQKWILIHILNNVESNPNSFGFDKNSSIYDNAKVHLKAESILKMDLMRFYDSINERRIYGIIKSLGYHPNLAVSIAKLLTTEPDSFFFKTFKKNEQPLKNYLQGLEKKNLFTEGVISQGAPSSPKLANLVCRNLDKRLHQLAVNNNLAYSRYADDLTFSGDLEILKKIKKTVSHIVKDENLFINHSKTKIIKSGGKFLVTGLNIENDKVTVPRIFKKEIEHHLYHCLNNGVMNHLAKASIPNRNFKEWLLGKIAFVHSIEKDVAAVYFEKFNRINWPI